VARNHPAAPKRSHANSATAALASHITPGLLFVGISLSLKRYFDVAVPRTGKAA
jgi:hypothetical protein